MSDVDTPPSTKAYINLFREIAPKRFGAMVVQWRRGGAARAEVDAIRRFGHAVRDRRMQLAIVAEDFVSLTEIAPLQLLLIESGLASLAEINAAIEKLAIGLRATTTELEALLRYSTAPQQGEPSEPN